jgi:hypothetical protein
VAGHLVTRKYGLIRFSFFQSKHAATAAPAENP